MSKITEMNVPKSLIYSSSHIYVSPSPEDDNNYGLVLTDVKPAPRNTHHYKINENFEQNGDGTIPPRPALLPRIANPTRYKAEISVPMSRPTNSSSQNNLYETVYDNVDNSSVKFHLNPHVYDFPASMKSRPHETSLNLIDFSSPPTSPLKQKPSSFIKSFDNSNVSDVKSRNSQEESLIEDFASLAQESDHHFDTGSLVEVEWDEFTKLYGVVRWIGRPESSRARVLLGIELEEEFDRAGDGFYCGERYFECPEKRALFVLPENCKPDCRFARPATSSTSAVISGAAKNPDMDFGGPDCPPISGAIPPISHPSDVKSFSGKFRGIQGHHNSCYLDATLFSMFTYTSVFDFLLYRPPSRSDISQYSEVQRLLREEIVNPLRQNFFVRADNVMKLRRLLQSLSSVTGLTNEEKDPEEFLHCLLSQTLRAEPFLKLHTGQEAFHHQLFVEKDEHLLLPSVQQLFEQSFLSSNIKLKEIPPCLILQMPRFGKSYKMYPFVLPSLLLDITDVLENSPRQCIVCGRLAELECPQCLGQCGNGLESTSFCGPCLNKVHSHKKRVSHKATVLKVPPEYAALQEHCVVPRVYMELFAVVCIATSHYVCFTKCGPGPDAPWCFFDSMADRKGEQDGYNIPEVVPCPDLPRWLSEDWDKHSMLTETDKTDTGTPQYVRRLFSDAYMCLYQSPDLLLYR